MTPCIVATDGHLKHSTHRFDRILSLMLRHELILHSGVREKMLTASSENPLLLRTLDRRKFDGIAKLLKTLDTIPLGSLSIESIKIIGP